MKKLLLLALVFIGLNTYAQRPTLPKNEIRPELRDLRFGKPNLYEPLRGRIIIINRPDYNRPVICKKCIKKHKKHGNHYQQSKRKNHRAHRPGWFR